MRILVLIVVLPGIQGCAALWVADKAADTAVFATKTTAKVGIAAAEVTWDAGSAAVDAAGGDEEKKEAEPESEDPAD